MSLPFETVHAVKCTGCGKTISLVHDTTVKKTMKEGQIMQFLMHQNILTIIGVQLRKEPISLIMEFKWEQDTSVTNYK